MLLIIPILSTTAIANDPPAKPSIDGPTNGEPGIEYDFIFMSEDPDEDNVYYYVSWGCCGQGHDYHKYGPYDSGVETTISKIYTEEKNYVISAYAQDINGAKSDVTTFDFKMPRERSSYNNRIIELFEFFMGRFPFFCTLFGL
jgi:hypothetical protein